MKKEKGFLTTRLHKPDVEDFKANDESEDAVYGKQFRNIRPLLIGALAILKEGITTCDSCGNAHDLLESFLDGMSAAEDAVNSAGCAEIPIINIDELKEKLGRAGRANVIVWVNADGILQRENFRIKGEGKTFMEIAEDKRKATRKQKSRKAA